MALGSEFDIKRHFTPSYNPWDERLCLVPNGDLFKSIRKGKVSSSYRNYSTVHPKWNPARNR